MAGSWAQDGIYTCVDAKGRRLTADRPNPECLDREQKVLNASGSVRRVVPPTPTAAERAAHEERERRAADERSRQEEERRLQRALLVRYPSQAAHEVERGKALQAVDEVILLGERRIAELAEERKALHVESAVFKSPAQWPATLTRKFDDNAEQAAAQQRLVAQHAAEKKRIHARFDEEAARLKALWTRGQTANAATAVAPSAAVAR
jgi:hypothetical protein